MRTAALSLPIVLLALLATAPPIAAADDPPEQDIARGNTEEVIAGAATLAGAGFQGGHGVPMILGMLLHGDQMRLWKMEEINKAMPLSPKYLRLVTDSTPLAPPRSKDKPADMPPELEPYCEAVFKSSLTSVDAFANSADRSATYADYFNEPWRWRGKVVHFEGTLRRIHRMSAPDMLLGKGIEDLYECWVFGSGDGTRHPVCLVCTELPAGVSPSKELNLKASFDAYFFKRLLYHAADSKPGEARLAPLFIGRSFVVEKSPATSRVDTDAAEWKSFLIVFLIGVLGTFVLAFGLHWWFRRNDQRVRARLRAVRTRDVILPDGAPSVSEGVQEPVAHAPGSENGFSANTDAS